MSTTSEAPTQIYQWLTLSHPLSSDHVFLHSFLSTSSWSVSHLWLSHLHFFTIFSHAHISVYVVHACVHACLYVCVGWHTGAHAHMYTCIWDQVSSCSLSPLLRWVSNLNPGLAGSANLDSQFVLGNPGSASQAMGLLIEWHIQWNLCGCKCFANKAISPAPFIHCSQRHKSGRWKTWKLKPHLPNSELLIFIC